MDDNVAARGVPRGADGAVLFEVTALPPSVVSEAPAVGGLRAEALPATSLPPLSVVTLYPAGFRAVKAGRVLRSKETQVTAGTVGAIDMAKWEDLGAVPVTPTHLYLRSSPAGGDNYDTTSHITIESWQRPQAGNFGESLRLANMQPQAKSMLAWYHPVDPNADWNEVTNPLKLTVWAGAHWAAQDDGEGIHGHWSVELPDLNGHLRTRFGLRFIDRYNGLTDVGVAIASVATSNADFTVTVGGQYSPRTKADAVFNGTDVISSASLAFTVGFDENGTLTSTAIPGGSATILEVLSATTARMNKTVTAASGQTVTKTPKNGRVPVLRVAGGNTYDKMLEFQMTADEGAPAGVRWRLGANNTTETGEGIGSDFVIRRYSNVGTILGTSLSIKRETGRMAISSSTPEPDARFAVNTGTLGSEHGVLVKASAALTASYAAYAARLFATGDRFLSSKIEGESGNRFFAQASGKHWWGDGTASPDATLGYGGTETLLTDGHFNTGKNVRINTYSQGGGMGVLAIGDATTAPSSAPSNAIVLFSAAGALRARQASPAALAAAATDAASTQALANDIRSKLITMGLFA